MFFMINSAISSGFFWETSTRRSLAFLYSGSRVCCNSDSDARGFAVRNRGRSRKRRIRARSVAPSASSQTTVPICFKRSIFSARKTMPPPVTIIAGSFRGNESNISVTRKRKHCFLFGAMKAVFPFPGYGNILRRVSQKFRRWASSILTKSFRPYRIAETLSSPPALFRQGISLSPSYR